jgi:hypothetical protein
MHAIKKWRCLRFDLRALLLVPIIVGGMLWWSTWPDRTARKFVQHLANHDLLAVRRMLELSTESALPVFASVDHPCGQAASFSRPQFQHRTFVDRLLARGSFRIEASHVGGRRLRHSGLSVKRGAVCYSGVLFRPNKVRMEPESKLRFDPYRLQFASASDVLRELMATDSDIPVTIEVDSNDRRLIISGPPKEVERIRARLSELDK